MASVTTGTARRAPRDSSIDRLSQAPYAPDRRACWRVRPARYRALVLFASQPHVVTAWLVMSAEPGDARDALATIPVATARRLTPVAHLQHGPEPGQRRADLPGHGHETRPIALEPQNRWRVRRLAGAGGIQQVTEDKDFKKVVRERAAKTGESYSTARSNLVQKDEQDPGMDVVRDQPRLGDPVLLGRVPPTAPRS